MIRRLLLGIVVLVALWFAVQGGQWGTWDLWKQRQAKRQLGKEIDSLKGEADTLGGFITEQVGKILRNNEFIKVENIKLIVESSDKRRVKMVKAIIEHEEV